MKNVIITILLLALISCKQSVDLDPDGIFTHFQTVLMADDYSALARELQPNVLESFRRRLEFSVEQPREGSWFTGSRDRSPTKEELSKIDDLTFFVTYMKGEREVIGNPFIERYRDAKAIASTIGKTEFRQFGKREFRHFVIQSDQNVARPTIFSFTKVDGRWLLDSPCIVDLFANQLRAAKGKSPEG